MARVVVHDCGSSSDDPLRTLFASIRYVLHDARNV